MSEFVRLSQYPTLLGGRLGMTRGEVMSRLEISAATFKRDLAKLRDQMHVPVRFNRDTGRYRIESAEPSAVLPGLWFSANEVLGLLTLKHLLADLEAGQLGPKLRPLQERLHHIMDANGLRAHDVSDRVRIVRDGKRPAEPRQFIAAASATLARKRLKVTHTDHSTGETLEREISPQRIVHYRDSWYLDAWCHHREALQSFDIDAIGSVEALDADAKEVAPSELDAGTRCAVEA